ncbi:MAG TPA: right-handed parallel beta-helix repeat-containing protein [Candidatus Deferrimicrobium sp.]|nr:right-handed parallel beta-helix repeat-containing protein [Candidatus Deferrimicrobium sp.]
MALKKRISIFILIPLILLSCFSFLPNFQAKIASNQNTKVESKVYIYYINGNNQLKSAASSGNGTLDDPYIIKDLIKTAVVSTDFPIYIQNTDQYFILKNSTASGGAQAITLDNVVHGTIENCTAKNSPYGIIFQYCNNVTVLNSTVAHITQIGIYLYGSDNTSVVTNIIYDCGWSGIRIYTGKFHDLSDNDLFDAGDTIYLESSHNNSIADNTIQSGNYGIYLHSSTNNTIINNTAVDNSVGMRIETTSINNQIIENNASDNNMWGINVDWSNKNTLINNTANHNDYYGFYLVSADFINLTDNTANANGEYGFYLKYLDNVTFIDNEAEYNNKTGVYIESCNYGTFIFNHINDNNETGFYLYYCDSAIFNNIVNNNSGRGIYLDRSDFNRIEWNTLHYNLKAIIEVSSYSNTIKNNDILPNPTLTEGNVTPATGNESTVFTYFVKYTDVFNKTPPSIIVVIDGAPFEMQKLNPADNTYSDGCIYYFNKTLSKGSHGYYFVTYYNGEMVRDPSTGSLPGPTLAGKPIPGFAWITSIFALMGLIALVYGVIVLKKFTNHQIFPCSK